MSYSHTFDDYLRDVPLTLSRRYFVLAPQSVRQELPLPRPYECTYTFEREQEARRAYDEYKKQKEAPPPPIKKDTPCPPSRSGANQTEAAPPVLMPTTGPSVLVPSKPAPTSLHSVSSSSSLTSTTAPPPQQQSFEDFEGVASVFDELELKSIDERRALNQIWGAVQVLPNSAVSYSVPPPAPNAVHSTSGGYPSITSSHSSTASSTLVSSAPRRVLPPAPPVSTVPHANGQPYTNGASTAAKPPEIRQTGTQAMLASKLITKGFRPHVVNLCLAGLKQEQLSFIEYYIKGVTNMEKMAVAAPKGLSFLIDCNITDKQEILLHAETVVKLVGMGFPVDKSMEATKLEKGNRVAAINHCLV